MGIAERIMEIEAEVRVHSFLNRTDPFLPFF